MKELEADLFTLPDWHPTDALVLVYPHRVKGREHLKPFYLKLLAFIPDEIVIIFLVKTITCQKEVSDWCEENNIKNKIELIKYPNLFDIWIRDYAPIVTNDRNYHIPVKFIYDPSYVEKKYEKYIQHDDKIGKDLYKRLLCHENRFVLFNWDMGNLTHNGDGTALISNQFIANNKSRNVQHELEPILLQSCGFSKIIFIPTEPYDVTGHADGMVRFIDEKTLVVGMYPSESQSSRLMHKLTLHLRNDLGEEFTLIRLSNGEPENYENEGIGSEVGNHMNFLRLGNKILIPYYSDEISGKAVERFRNELQQINLDIEVVPVDIPEIWDLARLGGVLNCVSWQVYNDPSSFRNKKTCFSNEIRFEQSVKVTFK